MGILCFSVCGVVRVSARPSLPTRRAEQRCAAGDSPKKRESRSCAPGALRTPCPLPVLLRSQNYLICPRVERVRWGRSSPAGPSGERRASRRACQDAVSAERGSWAGCTARLPGSQSPGVEKTLNETKIIFQLGWAPLIGAELLC